MVRKYAALKNGIVSQVLELELEDVLNFSSKHEMILDIEDIVPIPTVGYVLEGNKLVLPQDAVSRELFEIELNNKKSEFGIKLAKDAVNRIGARNKILNKTGPQVTALLTTLIGVKHLMETGALGTARSMCVQLKTVYLEYTDIFDIIINEINIFEANFGL